MPNAHDFSFETLRGDGFPLSAFAGRPVLIVNTASKCGFTPQYRGLEALWRAEKDAGLMIVGVPSNDFGGQEPGSHEEIGSFCELNYGVNFPMMGKTRVKGPEAHPFFRWAGAQGGFLAKPKWNFYKYLIGRDGALVDWFSSLTRPESPRVTKAIARTLGR